ncbi:MAG: tetratricopeptide repeat protein [Candidatus Solibacter usitatus]|nr:tetratricopeptide repeat protein [Candidatus Solibacter usitatus]
MKLPGLIFLPAALVAVSCSPKPPAGAPRVAILRFENLTGDPSMRWMERGAPHQLSVQLAASKRFHPVAVMGLDLSAQRAQALAGGITRFLHGQISQAGGKLRLNAGIEDAVQRAFIDSVEVTGPVAAGLLPLADAAARRLDADARPYGAHSQAAFSAYIEGIDAGTPAAATPALVRALAADPDFGEAYIAAVELALARQDRATAARLLAQARARGAALAEVDRARLDIQAALLDSDPAARFRALTALARLTPGDANIERALADVATQTKQWSAAAEHLRKALALQPGDPALLNSLGYVLAYAGSPDASIAALREYERARPAEPNPLDSLAEVHLYFGRLREAEDLFRQAFQKDANFLGGVTLLKAAQSRLLTGDLTGADIVFNEYIDARQQANDPLLDYRRAEWEYLTGRRKDALERLTIFAQRLEKSPQRDFASHAYAQRALWELELGNRAQAALLARKAASLATAQATRNLAATTQFLCGPEATAAEWSARANRALPDPAQTPLKILILSRALLYAGHFEAAEPLLRQAYDQAMFTPSDPARVLLAWALAETGKIPQAAPLIERNLVMPSAGPEPFSSLAFPRIFFLRALAAPQESEQNYRLFLHLSGPTPLRFGEEERARKALPK